MPGDHKRVKSIWWYRWLELEQAKASRSAHSAIQGSDDYTKVLSKEGVRAMEWAYKDE